jgi:hypothetical protein
MSYLFCDSLCPKTSAMLHYQYMSTSNILPVQVHTHCYGFTLITSWYVCLLRAPDTPDLQIRNVDCIMYVCERAGLPVPIRCDIRSGRLGTYSRACRRQEDLETKLENWTEWKLGSEGLLQKTGMHIYVRCIYLLFIHNKNLKYLCMTTTTVIRRHNMHNNHNCITQYVQGKENLICTA